MPTAIGVPKRVDPMALSAHFDMSYALINGTPDRFGAPKSVWQSGRSRANRETHFHIEIESSAAKRRPRHVSRFADRLFSGRKCGSAFLRMRFKIRIAKWHDWRAKNTMIERRRRRIFSAARPIQIGDSDCDSREFFPLLDL